MKGCGVHRHEIDEIVVRQREHNRVNWAARERIPGPEHSEGPWCREREARRWAVDFAYHLVPPERLWHWQVPVEEPNFDRPTLAGAARWIGHEECGQTTRGRRRRAGEHSSGKNEGQEQRVPVRFQVPLR